MFVRLFVAAVPNITERVCDQTRHLPRTTSWAAENSYLVIGDSAGKLNCLIMSRCEKVFLSALRSEKHIKTYKAGRPNCHGRRVAGE